MTHWILESLKNIAIMLPALLASLSFHEFFHALTATLLGDPTPKNQGRLTLNPMAHIDPFGLLFLLVFPLGWAKPVTFDQRNFKHPRLYSVLTALAGPIANFILALFALYCLKYLPFFSLSKGVFITFTQILMALVAINTSLCVFNLIPIPPLDGSHILMIFLVDRYPHVIIWFYRYSIIILLALVLLPPTRELLLQLINMVTNVLNCLVF